METTRDCGSSLAHPNQTADCPSKGHLSSLLDPLETKSPLPGIKLFYANYRRPEFAARPASLRESTFRHSGWRIRRLKIWEALQKSGQSGNRLEQFVECGSAMWLQHSPTDGDLRFICNHCHDRFCVPCQATVARTITNNLTGIIAARHVRFLTLTLRHSNTPLRAQIDRIRRSFLVLRRRAEWKSHVDGGAAFIEVKLSARDGMWHVHLHCLIEGSFWEQREISREWHEVTGDSSIVDVRRISQGADAARYVTKYVTKAIDDSLLNNHDKLIEAIVALKGTPRVITFGAWRAMQLTKPPKDEREWQNVASLDTLVERAKAGDDEARTWLDRWRARKSHHTEARNESAQHDTS